MAAARLIDEGYPVMGLHFITGYEPLGADGAGACLFEKRAAKARRKLDPIRAELGIDLHVIDLSGDFNRQVVDYFVSSYNSGLTPNPCMHCNAAIKFGAALAAARNLGADRFATGHYARLVGGEDDRLRLLKGVDRQKDQSYFLARLNQKQLRRAMFPLGGLTKAAVKSAADAKGWRSLVRSESQDVCFVEGQKYGDFLAVQPGFMPRPGHIEDVEGRVLGQHPGLHRFTVGQRRGINCPAPEPYYVIRLDASRNCLVVGGPDDLMSHWCTAKSVNWIGPQPGGPISAQVKVRYRHIPVPATVTPLAGNRARVDFHQPIKAVTPGQGAVFYDGDEVLGGGWINDEHIARPSRNKI